MLDCTISRQPRADRSIYVLAGAVDHATAWSLRGRVERDPQGEVVLDFGGVRYFSDLGLAVIAHGLTTTSHRVLLRGLKPHQLRIFRHCGVAVEELLIGEPAAEPAEASVAGRLSDRS